MKYTIQTFILLNILCISSALFGMEESKEPTYYYEFSAVLDDLPGIDDTDWVFRAYKNGQNGIPPKFKKAQQETIDLDSQELES